MLERHWSVSIPLHHAESEAALEGSRDARFLQIRHEASEVFPMCGRNIFHVDDADAVGGGIVLCRQEMRIARDLDAARLQQFPDGGLIGHRGDDPGIGQALIAAAGPAVERRFVRIVLGRAAVRAEENHAGEIGGQSHQSQRGLHEISLFGHGEPRLRETFEAIRNTPRADPMALAQFLIECFFSLRSAGQRVRRLAADPVRMADRLPSDLLQERRRESRAGETKPFSSELPNERMSLTHWAFNKQYF